MLILFVVGGVFVVINITAHMHCLVQWCAPHKINGEEEKQVEMTNVEQRNISNQQ